MDVEVKNGKIVAAIAKSDKGYVRIACKACIMATGSWINNEEIMKKYAPKFYATIAMAQGGQGGAPGGQGGAPGRLHRVVKVALGGQGGQGAPGGAWAAVQMSGTQVQLYRRRHPPGREGRGICGL